MLFPLGLLSQGGGGGGAGAFEQISTVFGTGSSATITFSSIPATYKHLQIRATPRTIDDNQFSNLSMRVNGDSASNYSWHFMQGFGTGQWSSNGVSASLIALRDCPSGYAPASSHGALVIDILDYTNSNKFKTVRSLSGYTHSGSNQVNLVSGNWRSTNAVTSLTITTALGSFNTASRFTLYGIKG